MLNKRAQMQYNQYTDPNVIEQYEADVMSDMIISYMSVSIKFEYNYMHHGYIL